MGFDIVHLRKFEGKILKVLPPHTPRDGAWDMIEGQLSLAMQSNDNLSKCNPLSLVFCCYLGARLGLDFSGGTGQAYLVPFGGRAQFMIGYKGWVNLVVRATGASSVRGQVVYKGEPFEWNDGMPPTIKHTPFYNLEAEPGRREAECAYAIATWPNGHMDWRVMPKWALNNAASKSRGGLWKTHYHEMGCKSGVRYLAKALDTTPDIQRALNRDTLTDVGKYKQIDDLEYQTLVAAPGQGGQAELEAELAGATTVIKGE